MDRNYCNDCNMVQSQRTEKCGDFTNRCNMELAMAYVLSQPFRNLYDVENALCAGTIFKDLDKPYLGAR